MVIRMNESILLDWEIAKEVVFSKNIKNNSEHILKLFITIIIHSDIIKRIREIIDQLVRKISMDRVDNGIMTCHAP